VLGLEGFEYRGGHGCLSPVSAVFCQRFLRRADLLSRGVLPSVVFLSVNVKPNNQEALADEGLLYHGGKYIEICFLVCVVMVVHVVIFWLVTPCSMRIQIIRNDTSSGRSEWRRGLRRWSVAARVRVLGVRIPGHDSVFCECW